MKLIHHAKLRLSVWTIQTEKEAISGNTYSLTEDDYSVSLIVVIYN